MSLPAPPIKGQRVAHPDWNGVRLLGVVAAVVNAWHADVTFYGWAWSVRVAIASLEAVP